MIQSSLVLLRGLVTSLGLSSVARSLHSVREYEPQFAESLLGWAARAVRNTFLAGPRDADKMARAAYVLALALRDQVCKASPANMAALEEAVVQAKLAVGVTRQIAPILPSNGNGEGVEL